MAQQVGGPVFALNKMMTMRPGFHYPILVPQFATTESLILREGIFAVEGLIVDLDTPGLGLWNHTLPSGTSRGATWSEDVLWLYVQIISRFAFV